MSNKIEIRVSEIDGEPIDEQDVDTLTVADLIKRLQALPDQQADVFFREPYDDGDEFSIQSVYIREDAVILTP